MAVLVEEAELAFVGAAALRHGFGQLARARLVFRVQQTLPGGDVRIDVVVGIPEHLLPAWRVQHPAALDVPVPHALLRAGEGEREPFFVGAKKRLGALPFGDVPNDHLNGVSLGVVEACGVDFDVGHRAVEPHQQQFGRRNRLAGQHPADAIANKRVALGMKQVER